MLVVFTGFRRLFLIDVRSHVPEERGEEEGGEGENEGEEEGGEGENEGEKEGGEEGEEIEKEGEEGEGEGGKERHNTCMSMQYHTAQAAHDTQHTPHHTYGGRSFGRTDTYTTSQHTPHTLKNPINTTYRGRMREDRCVPSSSSSLESLEELSN